jgi:pterin-4a-carbinolamine dehydratase
VTLKEHHPAWENIWRNVMVRLTTFDIGNQPSVSDIRLAEYLDELYRQYQPQSAETPGHPSGPSAPSAGTR